MRIRPQDITPSTQSPFMTVHAARVAHPIKMMLASEELFLSVRNNVRPGDRVDLCRYETGDWNSARVLEICTVLIVNKDANSVEFRQISPILELSAAKPAFVASDSADDRAELEIIPGDDGGHLVREVASGHVHKHFKYRGAADRYVADYGSKAQAEAVA